MRYISHPSTVSTPSLERVMGIVPAVNSSPFTNLDYIYIFILARANDQEATCDILTPRPLIGHKEIGKSSSALCLSD